MLSERRSTLKSRGDELERTDRNSERVPVYVRLRPFLEDESQRDGHSGIETFDIGNKVISIKKDYERKNFNFDYLFPPSSSQAEVYDRVGRPVLEGVLNGFNGTIFAYGQTGTGKTYTMMGDYQDKNERGIIPRFLIQIFAQIVNDSKNMYTVQLGYLQIYMEMLQDLIKPENNEIRIRESPENGVFVAGLEWILVHNPEECIRIISQSEKNRAVAFTHLNAHSSRSHAVLMIKLEKRQKYNLEENMMSKGMVTSILYLVDLAGSERVKKSKATGDRLHEAKSINYSLTSLGKCIHALTDPKTTFVPFRDSKLTRLLQDSLGGNSKTSLIVTIGPSVRHIDETISSLSFGQRAMKVENKPIVNRQKDYYALAMQLQAELDEKDDQLHKLEISQAKVLDHMNHLKKEMEELKLRRGMDSGPNSGRYNSFHGANGNSQEIDQMERKYKELIASMENEHKSFLEEIDKLMLEQETEIEELKKQNLDFKEKVQKIGKEIIHLTKELDKEREDRTTMAQNYECERESLLLRLREMEKREGDVGNFIEKRESEMKKKIEVSQRENETLRITLKEREDTHKRLSEELQNKSGKVLDIEESMKKEKEALRREFLEIIKKKEEEFKRREEDLKRRLLREREDILEEKQAEFERVLRETREKEADFEYGTEALTKELNNMQDKMIEQERDFARFKQDLANTLEEERIKMIESQDKRESAFQKSMKLLGDDNDLSKKKLMESETRLQELLTELKKVKKDFQAREKELLTDLENLQRTSEEKESEYKVKIEKDSQSLKEKSNKINEITEKFEKLKEESLYLNEETDLLYQESTKMTERFQESLAKLALLSALLELSDLRIIEIRRAHQITEGEKRALSERLECREEDFEAFKSNYEERFRQLNSLLEVSSEQYKALSLERETLIVENSGLSNEIADLKTSLIQNEDEISALVLKVDESQKQHVATINEIHNYKRHIENITLTLAEKEQRLMSLKESNESYEKMMVELGTKLVSLENLLESKKKEYEQSLEANEAVHVKELDILNNHLVETLENKSFLEKELSEMEKAYKILTAENKLLLNEISQVKELSNKENEIMEALESENAQISSDLDRARKQCMELQAQLKLVENRLHDSDRKSNQMEKQVSEQNEELKELRHSLSTSKEKILSKERIIEDLKKSMLEGSDSISLLETQLEAEKKAKEGLKTKFVALESLKASLEESALGQGRENLMLIAQVSDLSNQLETKERENEDLMQKFRELQTVLASLRESYRDKELEFLQLSSEFASLETISSKEKSALNQKLSEMERASLLLEDSNKNKDDENNLLTIKINEQALLIEVLNSENTKSNGDKAEQDQMIKQFSGENSLLKEQLSNLNGTLKKLEIEKKEVEGLCKLHSEENEELIAKINQLDKYVVTLKQELSEVLKKHREELNTAKEDHEGEVFRLQEQNLEHISNLEAGRNREIEEMLLRIQKLREELAACSTEIENYEAEIFTLRSDNQSMKGDINLMQSDNEKAEARLTQLETEMKAKNEMLMELEERNELLQEAVDESNKKTQGLIDEVDTLSSEIQQLKEVDRSKIIRIEQIASELEGLKTKSQADLAEKEDLKYRELKYKEQISILSSEKAQLELTLNSAEQNLNSLEDLQVTLLAKYEAESLKTGQLLIQKEDLESINQTLKEELKEEHCLSREQLHKLTSENEHHLSKIENLEKECEGLVEEIQVLKKNLSQQEMSLDLEKQQRAYLEESFASLEKSKLELLSSLGSKDSSLSELTKENTSFLIKMTEQQQKVEELLEEVKLLRMMSQNQEKKQMELIDQISEIEDLYQNEKQSRKAASQHLSELEEQRTVLEQKVIKLQTQNVELYKSNEELCKLNDSMNEKVELIEHKLLEKEGFVETILKAKESELNDNNLAMSSLLQEKEQLLVAKDKIIEENLKQAETTKNDLQVLIANISERHKLLVSQLEEEKYRLDDLLANKHQLEERAEELSKALSEKERDLEDYMLLEQNQIQDIARLQQTVIEMSKEKQNQETEINCLTEQKDILEEQISILHEKYQTYLKSTEEQVIRLNQEKSQLIDEYEKLQKEVEEEQSNILALEEENLNKENTIFALSEFQAKKNSDFTKDLCKLTLDCVVREVEVNDLKEKLIKFIGEPCANFGDPNILASRDLNSSTISGINTSPLSSGSFLSLGKGAGPSSKRYNYCNSFSENKKTQLTSYIKLLSRYESPNGGSISSFNSFITSFTADVLSSTELTSQSSNMFIPQLRINPFINENNVLNTHMTNFRKKDEKISEVVKETLDQLIFLVELTEELETTAKIDESLNKMNQYYSEKVQNVRDLFFATTPTSSYRRFQFPIMAKSQFDSSNIPTASLFSRCYDKRMNQVQNTLARICRGNYLRCDNSLDHENLFDILRMLNINNINDQRDLFVDLIKLAYNSYNYTVHLSEKSLEKDLIIKDLKALLQTVLAFLTRKEIGTKILENEKKILYKEYTSTMTRLYEDKESFAIFSKKIHENTRFEKAVLKIQSFFRKLKKIKLHKEKELLTRELNQFNSKTGKYFINQSFKRVQEAMSSMISSFVLSNQE